MSKVTFFIEESYTLQKKWLNKNAKYKIAKRTYKIEYTEGVTIEPF